MSKDIFLTNNLTNKKEKFVPINKNNIGTSVHYPVCLPNSKFYNSYLKLKPFI